MPWSARRVPRKPSPRHQRLHVFERDSHRCQLRYHGCSRWAFEVDHIIAAVRPPRSIPLPKGAETLPTASEAASFFGNSRRPSAPGRCVASSNQQGSS